MSHVFISYGISSPSPRRGRRPRRLGAL